MTNQQQSNSHNLLTNYPDIVEHLQQHIRGTFEYIRGIEIRKSAGVVEIANGVSISIQAGEQLYCTPRENKSSWYEKVEMGFPSKKLPSVFDEYCDELDKPTDTVYAYVPFNLIAQYIYLNGGMYA
jgi:adenylosuccinate synthase